MPPPAGAKFEPSELPIVPSRTDRSRQSITQRGRGDAITRELPCVLFAGDGLTGDGS